MKIYRYQNPNFCKSLYSQEKMLLSIMKISKKINDAIVAGSIISHFQHHQLYEKVLYGFIAKLDPAQEMPRGPKKKMAVENYSLKSTQNQNFWQKSPTNKYMEEKAKRENNKGFDPKLTNGNFDCAKISAKSTWLDIEHLEEWGRKWI